MDHNHCKEDKKYATNFVKQYYRYIYDSSSPKTSPSNTNPNETKSIDSRCSTPTMCHSK